ncbi:glycosyl transferases group 1 [mine drainage metagenome]|uniref:Glycosyl transferases group 1 n=1 Tax=mine drainage metagenome TaxID=410659 RepID=A0A1J5RMV2_9ZZZZ
MIRMAFTLIGGGHWIGGYNYMLNLVRALSDYTPNRVQPVLFFGTDMDEKDVAPFELIKGVVVIRHTVFDATNKGKRLRQALLTGCDKMAATLFSAHDIDVVFESAQFYGWHFPVPVIAWIPDFQHRHLRHLFDFKTYWKREIGFRVQVLSGRHVMLSSGDARQDCEKFYPSTLGRTHVVRFGVPPVSDNGVNSARVVADAYDLPNIFFFLPNQFWVHKNHECVIHALSLLKARGVDVVVAASGKQSDPRDPEHFQQLQQLIESCNLERNFRLLGLIPHEHIAALMRSCAALINPSKFEGWSTTVEEAKVMGTPIILSSLSVHREQSLDALFFDPTSPEQLAVILENFTPMSSEKRMAMHKFATDAALINMERFAMEFSGLVEQQIKYRK